MTQLGCCKCTGSWTGRLGFATVEALATVTFGDKCFSIYVGLCEVHRPLSTSIHIKAVSWIEVSPMEMGIQPAAEDEISQDVRD
jgi:hypothetical protein